MPLAAIHLLRTAFPATPYRCGKEAEVTYSQRTRGRFRSETPRVAAQGSRAMRSEVLRRLLEARQLGFPQGDRCTREPA